MLTIPLSRADASRIIVRFEIGEPGINENDACQIQRVFIEHHQRIPGVGGRCRVWQDGVVFDDVVQGGFERRASRANRRGVIVRRRIGLSQPAGSCRTEKQDTREGSMPPRGEWAEVGGGRLAHESRHIRRKRVFCNGGDVCAACAIQKMRGTIPCGFPSQRSR